MQSSMNFPFYYNGQHNVQSHFSNPNYLLQVQNNQNMFDSANYPLFKHQKLEVDNSTGILDPDLFFNKEFSANFYEEDIHSSYPTTDVCSSFAMSPSRDYFFSSPSEVLTPDLNTTDMERQVSTPVHRDEPEMQEEPKTKAQLAKMIETKLSSENHKLLAAIEQALQGQVNTADFNSLTSIEAAVVNAIIQKKDVGQKNKKQKGKKREEEKQKFFFKGVLKFTESKFFGTDSNQKKRFKKKQLKREAYYEHYWGEVAKESNIDLSNFFHPNKKLTSGKTTVQISSAHNPGLKSLNTTYIDLILTSDKFRADTIDYLDNVFLKETRSSRSQKVNKLVTKLSSLAFVASTKNAGLSIDQQVEIIKNGIYEYLVVNPKSKLPWADSEIQEARDFAYTTIIRQSSKVIKSPF